MIYKNPETQISINFWKLVVVLIIVNISGLVLKYFSINPYLILVGFRFHLSLVLPFILTFNSGFLPYIKKCFLNPEYRNAKIYLLLILMPLLIEVGLLFIFQKIDLGDPEYFYEFGVSSIADYPIYLIWNFPQLILIYFFLSFAASFSRFKFLSTALIIILLFAYEMLPFDKNIFSFWDLGILISSSVMASLLLNYYNNIYWFGISLFTLLWIGFLTFGNNSQQIINIFFASQYKSWEGFFEVDKGYEPFIIPAYLGITLILTNLGVLISRKRIRV